MREIFDNGHKVWPRLDFVPVLHDKVQMHALHVAKAVAKRRKKIGEHRAHRHILADAVEGTQLKIRQIQLLTQAVGGLVRERRRPHPGVLTRSVAEVREGLFMDLVQVAVRRDVRHRDKVHLVRVQVKQQGLERAWRHASDHDTTHAWDTSMRRRAAAAGAARGP